MKQKQKAEDDVLIGTRKPEEIEEVLQKLGKKREE